MIGQSLRRGLRDDGYAVDWVRDGAAAEAALQDPQLAYAVVLLDWGLPKMDGMEVLRALRRRRNPLPVLMLTARDALEDRVAGLDAGADDYLVKPFELAEVKARIRNLVRRGAGRADAELSSGSLTLNPVTRRVKNRGVPVELTAREFALLEALLQRPDAVLSRSQLEQRIYAWDEAVESNAVEFLIHSLRKKLGHDAIENVRGVGWRVRIEP